MQKHVGTLEPMRKTRNRVAHEFGLVDNSVTPMSLQVGLLVGVRRPMAAMTERVTDNQAPKYLAAVYETAEAIDQCLVGNFIGGYEIGALCMSGTETKLRSVVTVRKPRT
jgi:hypothetical protein